MACEYCKGKKSIFWRDNAEIVINCSNELAVYLFGFRWLFARSPINFCPMCGRDLIGDDEHKSKIEGIEDAIDSVFEKYPNTIEMLGDE